MKKILKLLALALLIFGLLVPIVFAKNQNQYIVFDSKTNLCIDFPKIEKIEDDNMYIQGWTMSETKNRKIEIKIDDRKINEKIEYYERPDVIENIKGYGNIQSNPKPGFKVNVNLEDIKDGKHTLDFIVINNNNNKILIEQTIIVEIKKYKSKILIDYPDNDKIENKEIYIQGWALSNCPNKKLEVQIDNKKINEISKYKRPDVLEAIKGYGTEEENSIPGFFGTLNTKNINQGKHEIKVQLINEKTNEIILEEIKKIHIKKYDSFLCIDYPEENKIANKEIYVQGWFLSNCQNQKIEIKIDDKIVENIEKMKRPDVLQKIKGYGTEKENPMPGYKTTINLENLNEGNHILKIVAINPITNEILAQKTTNIINKKQFKTMICIDYPKNNEEISEEIYIQGWLLSECPDKKVELQIDNQKEENIPNFERKDVLEIVKGYGTEKENPKPGFFKEMNLKDLNDGKHKIKIIVTNTKTNKILAQEEKNIIKNKNKVIICVDNPKENETVKSKFEIEGWIMSKCKEKEIEILLDDKNIKNDIKYIKRPDVLNAIKGYGDETTNQNPGFKMQIDLKNFKNGLHSIKINVINKENKKVLEQKEIKVNLKKYNTILWLDSPTSEKNYTEDLNILGWSLSENSNKKLQIFLDNQDISNKTILNQRPDVLNAIKGYGNEKENPKPGFSATIRTENLQEGQHKILIKVLDEITNEIMAQKERTFYINKIVFEKGKYGYSGLKERNNPNGADLEYIKIGEGPNVFFATFCMHGFEDLWGRDGTELILIAYQLRDKLLETKNRYLGEKWTIYLFPEVNPDGRRNGWTNNGPGRTTLFSYSSKNKGIDINRSWQVGNKYTRYTSTRNYNGTQGFQSCEMRFLRDFLLANKSKNGQTVLVDLHGWTQQLIGNPQICKFYEKEFPENSTKTVGQYGNGYLINWAANCLGTKGKPAKSALIELPHIGIVNHDTVIQKRLPNRYINATIDMLKNM